MKCGSSIEIYESEKSIMRQGRYLPHEYAYGIKKDFYYW
jgi:hypothetical protein